MTDNQSELVQHCIDTGAFVSIKALSHYLLFHQNVVKCSDNQQIHLQIPSAVLRQINGVTPMSIKDIQMVSHVDSSNYDMIMFADKSVVYTRQRKTSNHGRRLPYYVEEDLHLLESAGMSKSEIESFVKKFDINNNMDILNNDKIIQRIIYFTDIPTRLKCRAVSHRWKNFVDSSNSWNSLKLSRYCLNFNKAVNYFQNIDLRQLDLSESSFECSTFQLSNEISIYSLRSLCISTDHPLELFTELFKIAPFLQDIKLIQTYNSSLKLKNNNNHFYDPHPIRYSSNRLPLQRFPSHMKSSTTKQIVVLCFDQINNSFVSINKKTFCMVEEREFRFWRRLLLIFNIFYMILAFVFLFFAIFTRVNSSIIDLHLLVGLIILSIYLLSLSVFGIYATLKHHQVLLFFYIILLTILFLFQFILACTYLAIRGEKKYGLLKSSYQKSTDSIQSKYQCCGFDNSTEFNRKQTCANLPCCKSSDQCCETLPMCHSLLEETLNKNLKIIGSIMLVFTLTQIIAVYLTLKFRNLRNPTLFVDM
ncbi:unnamed protein product [Adineta ricciae]|uniref:F-box domain-containing protein n=1 Tax=Adineta ricciae TaxID=249248 RepID=A0A814DBP0_ADIRI|nr:unnamed protein product [Adineta ricciae]